MGKGTEKVGRRKEQPRSDKMRTKRIMLSLTEDEAAFVQECWENEVNETRLNITLTSFVKKKLFAKLTENKRI